MGIPTASSMQKKHLSPASILEFKDSYNVRQEFIKRFEQTLPWHRQLPSCG